MHILASAKLPVQDAGHDTLIFTPAANGQYSVRKAYGKLAQPSQNTSQVRKEVWDSVWQYGEIVPRVRLLLWKLLHNVLPLSKILNTRTGRGDPYCATCGDMEEDVMHFAFHCPFIRMCWFTRPLQLSSGYLTGTLQEVFYNLRLVMDEEQ